MTRQLFIWMVFLKFTVLTANGQFTSYNAKSVKVDYEPKGFIVLFHLNDFKFYSDTTAFLQCANFYYRDSCHRFALKTYILNEAKKSQNDTIIFYNITIQLPDPVNNFIWTFHNEFELELFARILVHNHMVKIFDSKNIKVKELKIKKKGSKLMGHVSKTYIDKISKAKLFSKTTFERVTVE